MVQPETLPDLSGLEEPAQAPAPEPAPAPVPPPPPPSGAARPAPRPVGRPRGSRKRRNPARRVDKPVITPRLSLFVTDSGTIEWERTNDETVARLRKAVSQPDALQRLGLVDSSGSVTVAPTSWASTTETLVNAVNAIAVQFAVNTWKLTDAQAELLILQREPETHRQVTELTGALLDKYFPGGFGAYDKEITLAILLGGFTLKGVQQIQAMRPAPLASVSPFPDAAGASSGTH